MDSLSDAPIVCSLSDAPIVRECMQVYVNSVRRVQPERCTYCTWVRVHGRAQCTCTYTVFGVNSLSDAPTVSACACICTLHLYVCSVRRGQPKRCTYCTRVRVRGRAHCTCTCTVFGMDSLSGVPIVRECVCVYVRHVRAHVRCSVWTV